MVDRIEPVISRLARAHGLTSKYVERQVRLHAPRLPFERIEVTPERAGYDLLAGLYSRFGEVRRAVPRFTDMARLTQMPTGCRMHVRDGAVEGFFASNGEAVPAHHGVVAPDVGLALQKDVHYLHSAREDTTLHYGLSFPEATSPFAYVAVSTCDRAYVTEALCDATSATIAPESIAVLTRGLCLAPAPHNAMSVLIGRVGAHLRDMGFRYLVSAVNPMMGFSGTSFAAAGFVPFASAPVRYGYSVAGRYAAPRSGRAVQAPAWATPPNLLLVRHIARNAHKVVYSVDRLVSIR